MTAKRRGRLRRRRTGESHSSLESSGSSTTRAGLENRLVWQVWERMLEIEFVDRSVALAGKAFVSFFPLVIVVAAFMPSGIRTSIFTTLTHRLGIEGSALTTAQQAFSSADDIRRATVHSVWSSRSSSPVRSPPRSSACT